LFEDPYVVYAPEGPGLSKEYAKLILISIFAVPSLA